MKYLFKLLFVCIALWGCSQAGANLCLDYDNSGHATCKQSYSYDKLTVYFKDADGVEQKFFAKRIIQKNNSALVHVDYDFVVNCISNCSDHTVVMNRYLSDWKNALTADLLYTKQRLCSAHDKFCCSGLSCDDAQAKPALVSGAVSHSTSADDSAANTNKKHGKAEIADSALTDSVASAKAGVEVAALIKGNETTDTLLAIVKETDSLDSVCYLQADSQCETLAGRVLSTEHLFEANLSHSLGAQFNESLQNFLYEHYLNGKTESDTQNMSCSKHACSTVVSASLL
ncbi:MAG: hypothetical protein A2203_15270 [Chromatiales bacterium RIFOXYA1_FULL_46_5]|nr:MAG: hypothetical protein A2203_15270 [Chromatiales bacterium RIFOXYA1_FULL_46_5]